MSQRPGLKIEDAFKRVRVAVQDKSGAQQVPWESSSLTGDFYFNLNVSVTVEAPEAPGLGDTAAKQEMLFWQSIQTSADPASFEVYLAEYPNGKFAALARLRLKQLQETQTAALVPPPEPSIKVDEMDATFVALKTSNVRAEPTTESNRVGRLTRDDAVAVTGKVADRNWYRIEYEGGTAYIFGTLIKEVDPGELAAWEKIANSSESADFKTFLGTYSSGHFAERAREKRDELTPSSPSSTTNPVDLAFWQSVTEPPSPRSRSRHEFGVAIVLEVVRVGSA